MHDRNGTPLAKGDKVLIEATITELHPTEDYCNVSLETVYGRKPDGQKETISALNTAVLEKWEDDEEETENETPQAEPA